MGKWLCGGVQNEREMNQGIFEELSQNKHVKILRRWFPLFSISPNILTQGAGPKWGELHGKEVAFPSLLY